MNLPHHTYTSHTVLLLITTTNHLNSGEADEQVLITSGEHRTASSERAGEATNWNQGLLSSTSVSAMAKHCWVVQTARKRALPSPDSCLPASSPPLAALNREASRKRDGTFLSLSLSTKRPRDKGKFGIEIQKLSDYHIKDL